MLVSRFKGSVLKSEENTVSLNNKLFDTNLPEILEEIAPYDSYNRARYILKNIFFILPN